ncbi:MAG: cyclase family protein [Azospirillaceae bacterium]|nr:cyclase family protein [Azospirillaceae bacterium]
MSSTMLSEPGTPAAVTALLNQFAAFRAIDLTHRMEPGMPTWPTHPAFRHPLLESYAQGDVSCHYGITCGEHTGTHLDAPRHFIDAAAGGWSIDEALIDQFLGRILVIDGTAIAPDGVLGAADVEAWEAAHGAIAAGDAVFIHFGWDRFWSTPATHDAVLADWPGLSVEACALLVARKIRLAGSDCLSLDRFSSVDYPAHRALLGNGIMIGENFASLGELPPICFGAIMPLPIAQGSGSPVRAIAFVPRD